MGIGALGCSVAQLLVRAGIGRLHLIDRDIVEKNNLIRQPLYTFDDVGATKIEAALRHLQKDNQDVTLVGHPSELTGVNANALLPRGIIIDCTDNLQTRFVINEYCHREQRTWIHTAALGAIGVCGCIDPGKSCISCYFGSAATKETCETSGVLNSAAMGTASQAASLFYGLLMHKKPRKNRLYRTDWLSFITREMVIPRRSTCLVCSGHYSVLGKTCNVAIRLCGTNLFQMRLPSPISPEEMVKRFGKRVSCSPYRNTLDKCITVFSDGRVLVAAKTERRARALFARYFSL